LGWSCQCREIQLFLFIIQSGNHPAEYLANQAEQFSLTLPDSLRNLPEEDFLVIKNSVIEKIKEKPTSIAEQAGKYYTLAFDYDGNFDRNEELIKAVENLTKDKSVEVLSKVLANETLERASVLLYAKEHEVGKDINSSFDSINQWKITRKYQ